MSQYEDIKKKFKQRSLDENEVAALIEKLERVENSLERLSSGNFSTPIEYSQIEAYQKYAESILESLRK
jgi:hypothetical protein